MTGDGWDEDPVVESLARALLELAAIAERRGCREDDLDRAADALVSVVRGDVRFAAVECGGAIVVVAEDDEGLIHLGEFQAEEAGAGLGEWDLGGEK